MIIKYVQEGVPSTVLCFIDIHHSLHEYKKELNVVRRWNVVLRVVDVFPKYGMEQTQWQCRGVTIGPITWNVFLNLILFAEERLRIPPIRRSFTFSLAAEFLSILTYLVGR